MGVAFFALFVVENTLFRDDAALFTLFVAVFTLSEICSSFYLVCGSFCLVFTSRFFFKLMKKRSTRGSVPFIKKEEEDQGVRSHSIIKEDKDGGHLSKKEEDKEGARSLIHDQRRNT